MSVVVFDFERKSMIADTVVTWGSHSTYACHKVKHKVIGDACSVLFGTIGVPALAAPVESYLFTYLTNYFETGATVDELVNAIPRHNKVEFDAHAAWLSTLSKEMPDDSKHDFTVMVAVRDPINDNVAVGMCDGMLQPTWAVMPLSGMNRICIAGQQVSAAFNGSNGKLSAANIVHYIGTPHNTFYEYTFDGARKLYNVAAEE